MPPSANSATTPSAKAPKPLGVLLAGVDLYLALGREFELVEVMKKFADDMKEPVDHTPTAEDLKRLYSWDPEGGKSSGEV